MCILSNIISEDICPTHPYSCPCQQKQSWMNFIDLQITYLFHSLSVCLWAIALVPRRIFTVTLVLDVHFWPTNKQVLRRQGIVDWAPCLVLKRYILCQHSTRVNAKVSVLDVFSNSNICMSLSSGVCLHESRKQEKKNVSHTTAKMGG